MHYAFNLFVLVPIRLDCNNSELASLESIIGFSHSLNSLCSHYSIDIAGRRLKSIQLLCRRNCSKLSLFIDFLVGSENK